MKKPKSKAVSKKPVIPARAQRVAAFQAFLNRHNACWQATAWAKGKTIHQAWRECNKKAWILWLIREAQIKNNLWRGTRHCACVSCCPESLLVIRKGIKLPEVFAWERAKTRKRA